MVNKLTNNVKPLDEIDKINEIIDSIGSSLEGVQINGTDLTVTNKKVNIPLAGTNTIGVAKANAAYGVYNNNGTLTISKATDSQVTGKTSQYRPLTPYNIDLAVKTGITTNNLTLTDAEKTSAKNWLGISESGGGSSRNIGEIVASTIPLTDAGLHLLDGALIQGSGVYSAFVTYIAGLRTQYSSLFTTESAWQSAVTQYGVCGKFVYNSTNNTVRLPKYSNKIFTGEGTAPVIGNGICVGLTDGTNYGGMNYGQNIGLFGSTSMYGQPFPNTQSSLTMPTLVTGCGVTTDPTKSGLIADLSNITTSLDGYYYIVVATSTKTDIQVDIDNIATDLNGKADTGLSNVPTSKGILTESYVNGTSWYRVYSDGWCEQGGQFTTSDWAERKVDLLIKYASAAYNITLSGPGITTNTDAFGMRERASSYFIVYGYNNTGLATWRTAGYVGLANI